MNYRYRNREELIDTGIEWIGGIPNNWRLVQLNNVSKKISVGLATSVTKYYRQEGIPIIRNLNIKENIFDSSDMLYLDEGFAIKEKNKMVKKDDVILVHTGSNIGLACIVPEEFHNTHTFTTLIVRANIIEVNPRFLMYHFNSGIGKIQVSMLKEGIGKDNLNVSSFKFYKCTLPSIKIQEKIAKFLDIKTAEFDSIISKKEALITKLEEAKKSLISEVVTGKVRVIKTEKGYQLIQRKKEEMKDSGVEWIGDIPKEWDTTRIKNFTSLKSVKNKANLELLSLYRDYGVVPKYSRDDNNNRESEDLSNYKYVEIDDLVLNKMKVWQGSLAVSKYEGIVSPAYIICKINKSLMEPKFVHHLLRSKLYIPEYRRLSTGIRPDQWDINYDNFKNIKALIPNISEQKLISEYIDITLINIEKVIDNTKKQIEKIKEAKQSLISEAVTGKIEVLD